MPEFRFYTGAYLRLLLTVIFLFFTMPFIMAEQATMGLSPEQIEEIRQKVEPVLKGKPATDIPEEDRAQLFLAEGLFPDSFDLFYRHAEYLALEKRSFTEAVPRLKKALEIKAKDLAALELLATCCKELKETAEEVSCWETIRHLIENDDSETTRELRERITLNLGRMAAENEMVMRQGHRFIIYTPVSSDYFHVDKELTDERLEEVFAQVTGDLECFPAFRTSIIVLDPIKFNEVKPTSWAGGFAQGGRSMTLKTESFPQTDPESRLPARKILLHEFTHNIVAIAADGCCPTWLNEGLAVFAENKDDSFTEFKPQIPSPDSLMTLEQLEKEFADIRLLDGGPRVHAAYNLAGLYARFLIQNHTMTAPRLILNELKNRKPFENALQQVCTLTVNEFEQRFRNWVHELANQ